MGKFLKFCAVVLFGVVFHLEGRAAEPLADRMEDQMISEAEVWDRLESGIAEVRSTASPEEIEVLNSIEAGVFHVKSASLEKPKQTRIGKIASKVGLAILRGVVNGYRPFAYGAGYLTGRYEKKNRLPEEGGGEVIDSLARIANQLRSKGESEAADLADRILAGDRLSLRQIEALVSVIPSLKFRNWEYFGSTGGFFVSYLVTLKVIVAAGLGALIDPLVGVGALSVFGSMLPCMVGDFENRNLARYCEEAYETAHTRILTSRIRGYLKGIKARNQRQ